MMNKIINWTAGSFFRTLGRIILYVFIGFLVAFLVDFRGIKNNFRLTDLLGFETIKAAELVETVKQVGNGYLTVTNSNQFTDTNTFYMKTIYSTASTTDVRNFEYTFDSSIRPTKSNGDYMAFQILNSQPTDITSVDTGTGRYCSKYELTTYTINHNNVMIPEVYSCKSYSSYDGTTVTTIQSTEFNHNNIAIRISYANGGWSMCEIHGNQVYCPLNSSGATAVRIIYDFVAENTTSMNIGLSRGYLFYKSTDAASAIESQTQQQQQQFEQQQNQTQHNHNEIMDTNTTSTESTASSFFENFSITDHGGLSSILTAPLTMFNSILNDSCVPATFTYRNKTVSLPCGQVFWDQAPNVRDWLSTLESGIIAYCILISLFKLIQKIESPSNSEVEVESL